MIIGAGIGGLAAAIDLAAAGRAVVVVERAAAPGGKLRAVTVGEVAIDAGPTVVTMRAVFDGLFAQAGALLEDHVGLVPLGVLARHQWADGAVLDLFADGSASEAAIGAAMGARSARDFRVFCQRSAAIYHTLDASFMRNPAPGLIGVTRDAGLAGLAAFRQASPFMSLWDALGSCFADPRLRQLFARYATYSGASPFAAPATLMLIAHAEQSGVWRVAGGMRQLAEALARLVVQCGGAIRYNTMVVEVLSETGRACGIRLKDGSVVAASAVIANADLGAIGAGLFGDAARRALAPGAMRFSRSLSAVTWQVVARVRGFPLSHHNVFFAADYAAEFAAIGRGTLPDDPTIYVCAQDRAGEGDDAAPAAAERLLVLVNAAAWGDRGVPNTAVMAACWDRVVARLARAGLELVVEAIATTGPVEFDALFPGAGGALYGRDLAGWRDPFQRPTARTRLPGFYLAGGSAHPGPGLPMAALSGRFAARAVLEDAA